MNLAKAMVHLIDALQHIGHVCQRTRQMIFAAIARLKMKLTIEQAAAA